MMQLKEFIAETLVQINDAVVDAQNRVRSSGGVVVPHSADVWGTATERKKTKSGDVQEVAFDVAVTTSDAVEKNAGGGVFVAAFRVGGQRSSTVENETVSRIQFSIPIVLPARPV
jgi:hypothetical protein